MSWRASAVKRVGPRTGANPQTGLRNTAARSKLSGSGRSEESRNRGICMVSTRIIIGGAVALVVVGAVGAIGSGGRNTTERATTATRTTNKARNTRVLRIGTVRLCGRDDLTAEIDIRRPSRVLQPPGPGAFAPSVRRPVATVVVRNPGNHRCCALLGRVRPNDQRSNWEDRHGQVGWAVVRGHLFTRLREAILAAGRLHL